MSRIFVGLPLSTSLKAEITQWRTKYEELQVRWTGEQNLHITLVPPWEETDVERMKASLLSLKPVLKPFPLRFNQVKYGPHARELNLVWALGEASEALKDLRQRLYVVLDKKPETRPFRLHTTLARFRPEDFSRFPIKWIDDRVAWEEEVEDLVLYESHLKPGGAEYEELLHINLS